MKQLLTIAILFLFASCTVHEHYYTIRIPSGSLGQNIYPTYEGSTRSYLGRTEGYGGIAGTVTADIKPHLFVFDTTENGRTLRGYVEIKPGGSITVK